MATTSEGNTAPPSPAPPPPRSRIKLVVAVPITETALRVGVTGDWVELVDPTHGKNWKTVVWLSRVEHLPSPTCVLYHGFIELLASSTPIEFKFVTKADSQEETSDFEWESGKNRRLSPTQSLAFFKIRKPEANVVVELARYAFGSSASPLSIDAVSELHLRYLWSCMRDEHVPPTRVAEFASHYVAEARSFATINLDKKRAAFVQFLETDPTIVENERDETLARLLLFSVAYVGDAIALKERLASLQDSAPVLASFIPQVWTMCSAASALPLSQAVYGSLSNLGPEFVEIFLLLLVRGTGRVPSLMPRQLDKACKIVNLLFGHLETATAVLECGSKLATVLIPSHTQLRDAVQLMLKLIEGHQSDPRIADWAFHPIELMLRIPQYSSSATRMREAIKGVLDPLLTVQDAPQLAYRTSALLCNQFTRGSPLSSLLSLAPLLSRICKDAPRLIPSVMPALEKLVSAFETTSHYDRDANDLLEQLSNLELTTGDATTDEFRAYLDRATIQCAKVLLCSRNAATFHRHHIQPVIGALHQLHQQKLVQFLASPSFSHLAQLLLGPNLGVLEQLAKIAPNKRTWQSLVSDISRHQQDPRFLSVLSKHFESLDRLREQIADSSIQVGAVVRLLNEDNHVLTFLALCGTPQSAVTEMRRNLVLLNHRHALLASVYDRFLKDLADENAIFSFLEQVSPNDSNSLPLKDALSAAWPISVACCEWLSGVSASTLFGANVWRPLVREDDEQLPHQDLAVVEEIIHEAASRWLQLATSISTGQLSPQELEQLVRNGRQQQSAIDRGFYATERTALVHAHLSTSRSLSSQSVYDVLDNLELLLHLRELVPRFVQALQYFQVESTDELLGFQRDAQRLSQQWATMKMHEFNSRDGLLAALRAGFQVSPEEPASLNPIRFIASLLIQDGNTFDDTLLKWLTATTDEQMNSIGRILSGTLSEAYGMLQSLRTRLAQVLDTPYQTYIALFVRVAEADRQFRERFQGRVQLDVDTEFLTRILPSIESARQAATITPYQAALQTVAHVRAFRLSVLAEPHFEALRDDSDESISLAQLKQAYQILEMGRGSQSDFSAADETLLEREGALMYAFELWQHFEALYRARYIAFSATAGFSFTIDCIAQALCDKSAELQHQAEQWSKVLKSLDALPRLARLDPSSLWHIVLEPALDHAVEWLCAFLPKIDDTERQRVTRQLAFWRRSSSVSSFIDASGSVLVEALVEFLTELDEVIAQVEERIYEEFQPLLPNSVQAFVERLYSNAPIRVMDSGRESVAGAALLVHMLLNASIDPCLLLVVSRDTMPDEIDRFANLWRTSRKRFEYHTFIIAHAERLSVAALKRLHEAALARSTEHESPNLLLVVSNTAQQQLRSLSIHLGIGGSVQHFPTVPPAVLEYVRSLTLASALRMYVSELPGTGKSHAILASGVGKHYCRISLRNLQLDALLGMLQQCDRATANSHTARVLHMDVPSCSSGHLEEVLIPLLLRGVLLDPKRPRAGIWRLQARDTLALELAAPSHNFAFQMFASQVMQCDCTSAAFSYQMIQLPNTVGEIIRPAVLDDALQTAVRFLRIREARSTEAWNQFCNVPDAIPLPPSENGYRLLVSAFQPGTDNQALPTFTTLIHMARFLSCHVNAMRVYPFTSSMASIAFGEEQAGSAERFQLNMFDLLIQVANQTLRRSFSFRRAQSIGFDETGEQWSDRETSLLLMPVDSDGYVSGINIIGPKADRLRAMFDSSLHAFLERQSISFQPLSGIQRQNMASADPALINAVRSLLQLDGSESSHERVKLADSGTHRRQAAESLRILLGEAAFYSNYIVTLDNLAKMIFILYRIRCGLPVVLFGEAGAGKTALLRFLFDTLLHHRFDVINVNSGTTVREIEQLVAERQADRSSDSVFIFLDEMNTADPDVIAFTKELMLDRHMNGVRLQDKVHILAAVNPYRCQRNDSTRATVGLVRQQFQQQQNNNHSGQAGVGSLVYRVNRIPLAFFDHAYDFGHLEPAAEAEYLKQLCQQAQFPHLATILIKCHCAVRELSDDPRSAVSMRDATRAITIFQWFNGTPAGRILCPSDKDREYLTIYLVYAFRFPSQQRERFLAKCTQAILVAQALRKAAAQITERLFSRISRSATIGAGVVALNDALCENLFALYVCVLTGTFCIIVGRPGTSKSLSVEILKLALSPSQSALRKELGNLPAILEHYHQCSPLSTSLGFTAVFDSAAKLAQNPDNRALVVLDELGLADLSPDRPIKVLHAILERHSLGAGESASIMSPEKQSSGTFSVVALSNWSIDAAQVSRGIVVQRTAGDSDDLNRCAVELFKTLQPSKSVVPETNLRAITEAFRMLDRMPVLGSFFTSMRDFFFAVKHFASLPPHNEEQVRTALLRNLSGHPDLRQQLNEHLQLQQQSKIDTLEMIANNITDSNDKNAVHIARHLMVLSKGMFGLELIAQLVEERFPSVPFNVLFGSPFSDDLEVLLVTNKLRQVEYALRTGGILVLCNAEQLYEALYMVLNQQYFADNDTVMTQIALGTSIRSIALPRGPFRIIAVVDRDTAIDPKQTSPAVLSRFEKHLIQFKDLLTTDQELILASLQTDPLLERGDVAQLFFGGHEELLASLARTISVSSSSIVEATEQAIREAKYVANPMALFRRTSANRALLERHFVDYATASLLHTLSEVVAQFPTYLTVVMTHSLRYTRLDASDFGPECNRLNEMQLFEITSELHFVRALESQLSEANVADQRFCLVLRHDAHQPLGVFQYAQHAIVQRIHSFSKRRCRVMMIVHLPARPTSEQWCFAFSHRWKYVFVEQLTRNEVLHTRPPLRALLRPTLPQISSVLESLTRNQFQTLVMYILGPSASAQLSGALAAASISDGAYLNAVRKALSSPRFGDTILDQIRQSVVEALSDPMNVEYNVWDPLSLANDMEQNAPLGDALWHAFRSKVESPILRMIVVSDIHCLRTERDMAIWIKVLQHIPPEWWISGVGAPLFQLPRGFGLHRAVFGRLLSSLTSERVPNDLIASIVVLVSHIDDQTVREAYYRDWLSAVAPPGMRSIITRLPLATCAGVNLLLSSNPEQAWTDWSSDSSDILAALTAVGVVESIVPENLRGSFRWWQRLQARSEWNWQDLCDSIAQELLQYLKGLWNERATYIKIVQALVSRAQAERFLATSSGGDLWLVVRIACELSASNDSIEQFHARFPVGPSDLLEKLVPLVYEQCAHPFTAKSMHPDLLLTVGRIETTEELAHQLLICPRDSSIVPVNALKGRSDCPSCQHPLTDDGALHATHLIPPNAEHLDRVHCAYKQFMLRLERVFLLYFAAKPQKREHLMGQLLRHHLVIVSWRFMVTLARELMDSTSTIDALLATASTGRIESQPNIAQFIRALIHICQSQSNDGHMEGVESLHEVGDLELRNRKWNMARVHRVARLRHALQHSSTENIVELLSFLDEQADYEDDAVQLRLLPCLRLATGQGRDRDRLGAVVGHQRLPAVFREHRLLEAYRRKDSPYALGFACMPTAPDLARYSATLEGLGSLEQQPPIPSSFLGTSSQLLQRIAPGEDAHLARLLLHFWALVQQEPLLLFRAVALRQQPDINELWLPGVEEHQFRGPSQSERNRWYKCTCGAFANVGDCGMVTPHTICQSCHTPLGVGGHGVRAGVRGVQDADVMDPKGFVLCSESTTEVSFAVRKLTPKTTRACRLFMAMSVLLALLTEEAHSVGIRAQAIQQATRSAYGRMMGLPHELCAQLWREIRSNVQVLAELLAPATMTAGGLITNVLDRYRVIHAFLNHLAEVLTSPVRLDQVQPLLAPAAEFRAIGTREAFERALGEFVSSNETARAIEQMLTKAQQEAAELLEVLSTSSSWIDQPQVLSTRRTVGLMLEREPERKNQAPCSSLLVEPSVVAILDCLRHLPKALQFAALVFDQFQGKLKLEQASALTVADALTQLREATQSIELVEECWVSFCELWSAYDKAARELQLQRDASTDAPLPTEIRHDSPMTWLILSSGATESDQWAAMRLFPRVATLLEILVEKMKQAGVPATELVVDIRCSTNALESEFCTSWIPSRSESDIEAFISNHSIDADTLSVLEQFASEILCGVPGARTATRLRLRFGDFVFLDGEQAKIHSQARLWRGEPLPPSTLEEIIRELEQLRMVDNARNVLLAISVRMRLHAQGEPLQLSSTRRRSVSAFIEEMEQDGILTKDHVPSELAQVFASRPEVQLMHLFSLVDAIDTATTGTVLLPPEYLVELHPTIESNLRQKLSRTEVTVKKAFLDALKQLQASVASSEDRRHLQPDTDINSMIEAIDDSIEIRLSNVSMKHLAHLLRIVKEMQ